MEQMGRAIHADGFGLAYFDTKGPSRRTHASLFKSVTPAWSDTNLAELLEVVCHLLGAEPEAGAATDGGQGGPHVDDDGTDAEGAVQKELDSE